MILATAGHIDHGKTALVRALTGVDADRLPEEKRRGMTIDLGFAYASLPDGTELGFVDVPGHERFLPNMLAGILSIDRVLLIVAADDGPRPQTIEHLDVLELIGVPEITGVITKIDRVPPERLAAVETELALLLDEAGYPGASNDNSSAYFFRRSGRWRWRCRLPCPRIDLNTLCRGSRPLN